MGTIEVFDHTADVGLRIEGDDPADLFRTAAEGLFDYVVANREDVRGDRAETVALRADSMASLLIAWLNELIFLCETRHLLFNRFEVDISDDGLALEATIRGETIDRDRHVLDHEVKAVTHHGASLEREGTGWVAEVILDI
jgi:SHS2 domain-containing protein